MCRLRSIQVFLICFISCAPVYLRLIKFEKVKSLSTLEGVDLGVNFSGKDKQNTPLAYEQQKIFNIIFMFEVDSIYNKILLKNANLLVDERNIHLIDDGDSVEVLFHLNRKRLPNGKLMNHHEFHNVKVSTKKKYGSLFIEVEGVAFGEDGHSKPLYIKQDYKTSFIEDKQVQFLGGK